MVFKGVLMREQVLRKKNDSWVPIPEKVLRHVGLRPGSYVEVTDDGYHVILTPVEEEFTKEEWDKLEALAERLLGSQGFDKNSHPFCSSGGYDLICDSREP